MPAFSTKHRLRRVWHAVPNSPAWLAGACVWLVAVLLLSGAAHAADTAEGLVVSVHDGDNLTVLVGKQQVKVRLAGIDAPELRQPFGNRSKQSLADLCFQELAKVEQIARDRYGRSVGRVECRTVDAGAHQVATGMASWVYDRYPIALTQRNIATVDNDGGEKQN